MHIKSNTFIPVIFAAFVSLFLFQAAPLFAQDKPPGEPIERTGLEAQVFGQLEAGAGVEPGGKLPADPRVIAARVIQIALGFLGIIFTILLLMSGYWFFTAKGEEDKITKAKDTARRAIIGLIIILIAYSIVTYILVSLRGVVEEGRGFFLRRR